MKLYHFNRWMHSQMLLVSMWVFICSQQQHKINVQPYNPPPSENLNGPLIQLPIAKYQYFSDNKAMLSYKTTPLYARSKVISVIKPTPKEHCKYTPTPSTHISFNWQVHVTCKQYFVGMDKHIIMLECYSDTLYIVPLPFNVPSNVRNFNTTSNHQGTCQIQAVFGIHLQ